jgi:hypothetical protein
MDLFLSVVTLVSVSHLGRVVDPNQGSAIHQMSTDPEASQAHVISIPGSG